MVFVHPGAGPEAPGMICGAATSRAAFGTLAATCSSLHSVVKGAGVPAPQFMAISMAHFATMNAAAAASKAEAASAVAALRAAAQGMSASGWQGLAIWGGLQGRGLQRPEGDPRSVAAYGAGDFRALRTGLEEDLLDRAGEQGRVCAAARNPRGLACGTWFWPAWDSAARAACHSCLVTAGSLIRRL